jgi:LCP family protein required for cell wall assembly
MLVTPRGPNVNGAAQSAARLAITAAIVGYLIGGWLAAAEGLAAARRTADAWAHRPAAPVPAADGPSAFEPGEESTLEGIPTWGGRERINILLLGIDTRPDEVFWEPGRTDFIAVATIDPVTRSAGLISFPRDLWLPIPVSTGVRFNERINAAYRIGELERAPGGGPAVARRTIEYNFGIRTHFYVIVDFESFVRLIDRLGGVTVDVERPLKDNLYPTETYGYKRIYYPPGLQRLDGRAALEYVRSRHQDSDFERNRRQQKILVAARQKALDLNLLPTLPRLLLELRQEIRTDMSPAQMVALARLAVGIDLQDVTIRSIGLEGIIRVPGELYFLPNRPVVSAIIAEVFTDPRVRREAAQIVIVADASTRANARRLASTLAQRGMVTRVEERPSDEPRLETVVIDYTGKPATLRYLAEQLKLDAAHAISDLSGLGAGDMEILVGADLRIP